MTICILSNHSITDPLIKNSRVRGPKEVRIADPAHGKHYHNAQLLLALFKSRYHEGSSYTCGLLHCFVDPGIGICGISAIPSSGSIDLSLERTRGADDSPALRRSGLSFSPSVAKGKEGCTQKAGPSGCPRGRGGHHERSGAGEVWGPRLMPWCCFGGAL